MMMRKKNSFLIILILSLSSILILQAQSASEGFNLIQNEDFKKHKEITGSVKSSEYTVSNIDDFPQLESYRAIESISLQNELIIRKQSIKALTTRNPISIVSDADFGPSNYNFMGNGTQDFPYIIENCTITNNTSPLIYIRNTRVYFEIRFNYLDGINGSYNGIQLENVSFGLIKDNDILNCENGIYIGAFSHSNRITLNDIFKNTKSGVGLNNAHVNTITNNSIYENGINGIYVGGINNTIAGNSVFDNKGWAGIELGFSIGTIVEHNNVFDNLKGNGITLGAWQENLSYSSNIIVQYNTIYNNNYSGIRVEWTDGNTIAHNTIYWESEIGISLDNASNTVISNNIVHNNNWEGIRLVSSQKNTLKNNLIYNNTEQGIRLSHSSNNHLFTNTINFNRQGINLRFSNDTFIENNFVTNSRGSGIVVMYSTNVSVIHNMASGNSRVALENPNAYSAGIFLLGSFGIVTNNTLEDNLRFGIGLAESALFDGYYYECLFNDIISNTGHGIFMELVDYSTILENEIHLNGENGIFVNTSDFNEISLNGITQNGMNGIFLINSNDNLIADNKFINNGYSGKGMIFDSSIHYSINQELIGHGILLDPCERNLILNNKVKDNAINGIFLISSRYTGIIENDVSNNLNGVVLEDSDYNNITDNKISENGWKEIKPKLGSHIKLKTNQELIGHGILLDPSDHNSIVYNTIFQNAGDGIYIIGSETYVTDNLLLLNGLYGIRIVGDSIKSMVKYNDFVENNIYNPTSSQAFDDGDGNVFEGNYWSDLDEKEGVYYIDGSAENMDATPSYIPNIYDSDHYLGKPIVLYPNGEETISGKIEIFWNTSIDSEGHKVIYWLFYSVDAGSTWELIANRLEGTSFTWDTTTVIDGSDYLIKVIAVDTEGVYAEDTSDSTFSIENGITTTTTEKTTTSTTTTKDTGTTEPKITPSWSFSVFLLTTFMLVVLIKTKRKSQKE